ASSRFVDIIPEINLPGHSLAALASYPNLSCSGGSYNIPTGNLGIIADPFCAGNDSTFLFFEGIVDEVIDLFPADFISLNGRTFIMDKWRNCDKCQARIKHEGLKNELELRKYFVNRVEKYILSKGKNIIAAGSFLINDVSRGAMILSSRKRELKEALEKGYIAIYFSSEENCFSCKQTELKTEPKAFDKLVTLEDIYSSTIFADTLSTSIFNKIIGAQSIMRSDYLQDGDMVEYMLLPRLCAYAEKLWTFSEKKNFNNFVDRLISHYEWLDRQDINFYIPAPAGLKDVMLLDTGIMVNIEPPLKGLEVHYTLDGSEPTINSPKFESPIIINEPKVLKAKSFTPHKKSSRTNIARFTKNPPKEAHNNLVNLYPGIKYTYLTGKIRTLENIDLLVPINSGYINEIKIPGNVREDYFGIIYEGYIFVKDGGIYSFHLSSDDGTRLYIDEDVIIDNDGIHHQGWVSGQVSLKAGYHSFRLEYFDFNMGQHLDIEIEGPGISRSKIPPTMFFYSKKQKLF
ncbi:MAG: family 20 glycosylhydrolase, partial [Cyclobacteriaceae bacterium]